MHANASSSAKSLDFLHGTRRESARAFAEETEDDEYDAQHYRAFGVLRKVNGALFMIDFISRGGSHCSVPYAHLERIEYDGGLLVARFSDLVVTIRGHNLADCHRHLLAHRVLFVAEADHATQKLAAVSEPLISELTIEQSRLTHLALASPGSRSTESTGGNICPNTGPVSNR